MALDPQFHHAPLRRGQFGQDLVEQHPQDDQRYFILAMFARRQVPKTFAAESLPNVSFPGLVVGRQPADLVQGQNQQQLPQLVARRHVIVPLRGPPEKCPKYRLDDILRIKPRRQDSDRSGLGPAPVVAPSSAGTRPWPHLALPFGIAATRTRRSDPRSSVGQECVPCFPCGIVASHTP